MGTWSKENPYDNALGLARGPVASPGTWREALWPARTGSVTAEIFPPTQTYSGEFYGIAWSIGNGSNTLVEIKSVKLNGQDFTLQTRHVAPGLSRLLLPGQLLELDFDYLREPNFLFSGIRKQELFVETDLETEPQVLAAGFTEFMVDTTLVTLGVGLGVVASFITVVLLWRLFVRPRLRRAALERAYLRTAQSRARFGAVQPREPQAAPQPKPAPPSIRVKDA